MLSVFQRLGHNPGYVLLLLILGSTMFTTVAMFTLMLTCSLSFTKPTSVVPADICSSSSEMVNILSRGFTCVDVIADRNCAAKRFVPKLNADVFVPSQHTNIYMALP